MSINKSASKCIKRLNRVPLVSLMIGGACLLAVPQFSFARGEISEVFTELRKATLSQYIDDGISYQWGQGQDLVITGFSYQGMAYKYDQLADRVEIKRANNFNAQGKRCSVFAETVGSSLHYAPSYPVTTDGAGHCDMAAIISGNVLNVGALDVFSNAGQRSGSQKNIERIDFIIDAGVSAGATKDEMALLGHVVIEKSGNNPLQMAAIIELDTNGNPLAYGPLVYINHAQGDTEAIRYGMTDINLPLDFLATADVNPGYLHYTTSMQEVLGMAFINQMDLGLSVNQTYYGFSMFGNDVDANVHTLTNPETFPKDSTDTDLLGPGDADFFAAFARLNTDDDNQAPVANDDFVSAAIDTPVMIDVLENDFDLDGDKLIVVDIGKPENGTLDEEDGRYVYVPAPGFSGTERIEYTVDDGHGGQDTARLIISVTNVAGDSSSPRIATGLRGHGAGSFDGLMFMLLSIFSLMRVRRR